MAQNQITVLFITHLGTGFAGKVQVAADTTVGEFLARQLPSDPPENYTIKVNYQVTARDQVLKDGDRVSAVAKKMDGAFAAVLEGSFARLA